MIRRPVVFCLATLSAVAFGAVVPSGRAQAQSETVGTRGLAALAATDTRLNTPVSERIKILPIQTVLKRLATDSGIPMEAAAAIWPLKLTVLVKNEPVGVVMDRIADVLHGAWQADGTLYRLEISSDWISRESTFIDAEAAERRKDAEATINTLIAGTAVPYDQVGKILSSDDAAKLPPEQRAAFEAVAAPDRYLLGSMFRSMSASDVNAFWAGRIMHTSAPLPGTPGLGAVGSGDAAGNAPQAGSQGFVVGPVGRSRHVSRGNGTQVMRVSALFDPLTGRLSTGSGGREALQRDYGNRLIDRPYPTGDLVKLPFGREALDWNQETPVAPDLAKPVAGASPAGKYYAGVASMADALEYLHDQTGAPIVADAFRTPAKMPKTTRDGLAWLLSLRTLNSAYVRVDHGFVMLRHGGFWRLRLMEAPEELYAKLEKTTPANLDAYADFAGALTPLQTLPFRVRDAALLKVDPEPLRVAMDALQFYSSLGASERQRALSGVALSFAQMSGTSQELFLTAMEDPSEGNSLGRGIANPEAPQVAQRLGFLIDGGPVGSSVGRGIGMIFGVSPTQGVRYVVPFGPK